MTFLEILQRACRRVGYAIPASVTNLERGQQALWNYIGDVYNDIQTSCNAWDFLTSNNTLNIQAGKREYTITELGIPECRAIFEDAYLIDVTTGKFIQDLELYDQQEIDRLVHINSYVMRPYSYSFKKGVLSFAVTPDIAYQMRCQTYRAPYTDVTGSPAWNEEHHMIIYHGILKKYSVDDNDPELFQSSSVDYANAMNRMLLDHSPGLLM